MMRATVESAQSHISSSGIGAPVKLLVQPVKFSFGSTAPSTLRWVAAASLAACHSSTS